MSLTTLDVARLAQVHIEGARLRGSCPFEDPAMMARYVTVYRKRGREWAESVLCRDLSRPSRTWGPWLVKGEPEILVLADEAEEKL